MCEPGTKRSQDGKWLRYSENLAVPALDESHANLPTARLRQRSSREDLEEKGILKPDEPPSEARVRLFGTANPRILSAPDSATDNASFTNL